MLTEASLLKMMETAGKLIDDKELSKAIKDCGIGTPATRAAIIEGLIKSKLITRDKKNLIPTAEGLQIYEITKNQVIAMPQATGEWECKLNQIADGKYDVSTFSGDIIKYTKELTKMLSEQKVTIMKTLENQLLDKTYKCPVCGGDLRETEKAIGCSNYNYKKDDEDGCHFVIWKEVFGHKLTSAEAIALITNLRTDKTCKCISKSGKKYDAYLLYNKERFVMDLEFEERKTVSKCPVCGGDLTDFGKAIGCSNYNYKKMMRNLVSSQYGRKYLATSSQKKKLQLL